MKFLQFQLFKKLIHNKKRKIFCSGFTLIEVLVVTIMSSIIISSLLFFMVDIMRASSKETARKNTLQDMQRAVNYITNDLQEAVYIYTGEELEDRDIKSSDGDGIKDIMDLPNSGNLEFILVFWKLEETPYASGDSFPSDCTSVGVSTQTCEELKISQRSYTLVAYLQDKDPTDTWQGESVIYRYQLRKYFNTSTKPFNNLEKKSEYIDPQSESSFANWPYNNEGNLPDGYNGLTVNRGKVKDGGSSNALVDFVDSPNNSNLTGDFTCPDVYARTPENVSTSNSFYACIENQTGQQIVTVYLRGNPKGRVNLNFADGFTPLPTLNSTAILRGTVAN